MTTFFGILLVLLIVNAILLFFSVDFANSGSNKTKQKNLGRSVTKVLPRKTIDNEYKKAV